MMEMNIENNTFNLEHSIFPDSATLDINKTHDSCTGDKREKHANCREFNLEENTIYLEEPILKKFCPGPDVQLGRQCHSKVKDFTDNHEPEPECDNSSGEVSWKDHSSIPLFCDDSFKVIQWLQQRQLLKSEVRCDSCYCSMRWSKNSHSNDGYDWRCQRKHCTKYKCSKSIRLGSLFANSRISLPKWFDIMYLWSERVEVKSTGNQVKIGHKSIILSYGSFREVCELYFKANPIELGGPGIIIEMDIFCLSHNSKRIHGPEPQLPISILCIVDNNCTPPIGFMEIIETKDLASLLPKILKVVEPGSIIHSKDWRAYRKIQGFSDTDEIVNHSVNFVDVNTSVHIQTIVSYWNKHRSYIKAMRGCRRNLLNSYLQEFMWRERFSTNVLENLCEQIAIKYSDDSYIENTNSFSLREETGKQTNYLEMKLGGNTNYLEKQSIFQDHITQKLNALDASYNTDGVCSWEKIKKESIYIEMKLEENTNH